MTKTDINNQIINLTHQQITILLLLYRFRFLDTKTIQLLMQHKLPTRIQSWLKDLTYKGYTQQFYDKSSFSEITKPAVYCLTSQAKDILRFQEEGQTFNLQELYREKNRSEQFRSHCNNLAQLYLKFQAQYINSADTLRFYTKIELTSFNHFPQPLPDAYMALKRETGQTKRYFLELLDRELPSNKLKQIVKRYIECSEGDWKDKTNEVFPSILLICTNTSRQTKLKRLIERAQIEEYSDLAFYLTNQETIKSQGLNSASWQKVN